MSTLRHATRVALAAITALALVVATAPAAQAAPWSQDSSGPDSSSITAQAATNYYVNSATGSDSNSGTSPSTPWRSLAPVRSRNFVAGDVINLAAGSSFDGGLVINDSGSAASPITFQAYGSGAKPIIRNPGDWSVAVDIQADYVILDGVLARDAHHVGVKISSGADHNIVRNCESTSTGIGFGIWGQFNLVTNNYAHDLTIVVNTQGGDDDFGAVGIWLFNSNNEVSYNLLVRCEAPSYDYGNDGGGIEWYGSADNSYVHHNWVADSNGFMEIGGGSAINTRVAYNVSVNNGDVAYWHLSGTYASQVQNFRFENNTIVDTSSEQNWSVIGFGATPSADTVIFRNNVVYVSGFSTIASHSGFTHDHNVYYTTNSNTPLGFSLGTGEVRTDPRFTNLGARDFTLQPGSPAIDMGASLGYATDHVGNAVPVGSAPDMGAFEYGTGSTSPTSTAVPPTATRQPTATAVPPTATRQATATATRQATATPTRLVTATATRQATSTAVLPTPTRQPTATAVPPTATTVAPTAVPPTAVPTTAPTNVPEPEGIDLFNLDFFTFDNNQDGSAATQAVDGNAAYAATHYGLNVVQWYNLRYYPDLISRMRAHNAGTKVLMEYATFSYVSERDDWYQDVSTNHSDWFLLDAAGNRVRATDYTDRWYVDVSNTAWQSYWVTQMVGKVRDVASGQAGWDGVYLSNVLTARVAGLAGSAKFGSDAAYEEAVYGCLANVYAQFRQAGVALTVNLPNTPAAHPYADWAKVADGVSIAGFASDWSGYRSQAVWEQQVAGLEQISGSGKIALVRPEYGSDDQQARIFGLASYLLAKRSDLAYFSYQVQNADTYNPQLWYSEWEAQIGKPNGARFRTGPVWQRLYTGGLVIVNPTDYTFVVRFRTAYSTLSGSLVRRVTLAPHQAAILLRAAPTTGVDAAPDEDYGEVMIPLVTR